MNYADLVEKAINNYSKKNRQENVTNATSKKKKTMQIQLKKRGDYKEWVENWRISDNEILQELEEAGIRIWIDTKGNFVFYDVTSKKRNTLESANKLSLKISSLLGKKVEVGKWSEAKNAITPLEIISIVSEEFRPDMKKRFFKLKDNGAWYLNTFTPTKYMNITNPPKKEPTTILNLIKHLVNYKEDRYHYFLNWLSYYWVTFKKPQTSIVFRGEQGAGKSTLANEVIAHLFGKEQIAIINNDVVDNKFRGDYFANKMFNIFEETSKGDAKSNKNIKNFIKEIITNEIIPMDKKNEKGESIKVIAPSLFFTNEVKFLEIEPSDRRFTIFTTGFNLAKTNFLGFGSYELLQKAIQAELEDFSAFLYNYQVDVKLANTPMDTPEKKAIIQVTNTSYQVFLEALKSRDLDFFDPLQDTPEHISIYDELKVGFVEGKIKRAFLTKLFNAYYNKNITPQKLIPELKAIDPSFFENVRNYNNTSFYIILP